MYSELHANQQNLTVRDFIIEDEHLIRLHIPLSRNQLHQISFCIALPHIKIKVI